MPYPDENPLKMAPDNDPTFPYGVVQEAAVKFRTEIKSQFPDRFCPKCGGPMWPSPHQASTYKCASCDYTE